MAENRMHVEGHRLRFRGVVFFLKGDQALLSGFSHVSSQWNALLSPKKCT